MAIALVASGIGTGVTNPNVTVNMSGADFLIMLVARYTGGPAYNVSDSSSNTWNGLTEYTQGVAGGAHGDKLFYAWNPTVTSSQNFINTATSTFGTLIVLGFSGVRTSSDPYNGDVTGQNNFSVSNGAVFKPGAITVTAGDVAITGLSQFPANPSSWSSIDLSYTIAQQNAGTGGVNFGGAAAYLINGGSTGSQDVAWTPASAVENVAGTHASFAAATAAAGHPTMRRWGGTPYMGGQGIGQKGGGGGRTWGRHRSGIIVPSRFTEAA